jgi:hypothetical protein
MTERVPYTVIKKLDTIEIRHYKQVILAVTNNDDDDDSGFNLLFQYISGANQSTKKISMTAPVITSEKIAMTAPVIARPHTIAFPLPPQFTKETVPKPTNPAIRIEIRPEMTMAVLRFSGHTPKSKVQKQTETMLALLQQQHLTATGEPVLMRYNSPFTPGFLRRNEVAVELVM